MCCCVVARLFWMVAIALLGGYWGGCLLYGCQSDKVKTVVWLCCYAILVSYGSEPPSL